MDVSGELGHPLELSVAQRTAIRVYGEFLESVARSDVTSLTVSGGSVLGLMVSASSAVLSASLPDCHYAPPGASIGPKWSGASPPRMVLRCTHTIADGGPHCWDGIGGPTTC